MLVLKLYQILTSQATDETPQIHQQKPTLHQQIDLDEMLPTSHPAHILQIPVGGLLDPLEKDEML